MQNQDQIIKLLKELMKLMGWENKKEDQKL